MHIQRPAPAGLLVLTLFLTAAWSAAPFGPAVAPPAAAQTAVPGNASKEQLLAAFLARYAPTSVAGTPAARPAASSALYRVLNVRSAAQECGNYCGPAATYEALTFSGLQTSQRQVAGWLGTPGCSINAAGTCLPALRATLNQHALNLPAPNWYGDAAVDDAMHYWGMAGVDVLDHGVPLGNLISPNPPDGSPFCLPTWCQTTATSVHYVLSTGLAGVFDGSPGSAAVRYVDTATGMHGGAMTDANAWWVSVAGMANVIQADGGYGGCDGSNDLVW